jgi:hypothetical protein
MRECARTHLTTRVIQVSVVFGSEAEQVTTARPHQIQLVKHLVRGLFGMGNAWIRQSISTSALDASSLN